MSNKGGAEYPTFEAKDSKKSEAKNRLFEDSHFEAKDRNNKGQG